MTVESGGIATGDRWPDRGRRRSRWLASRGVGGGWSRERGETGTRRGCPGSGPVAGHHTGVTESIDDVSAPVVNRGAPRDAQSAAALARYDRMARLPLVLSALLPLVIAPGAGQPGVGADWHRVAGGVRGGLGRSRTSAATVFGYPPGGVRLGDRGAHHPVVPVAPIDGRWWHRRGVAAGAGGSSGDRQ